MATTYATDEYARLPGNGLTPAAAAVASNFAIYRCVWTAVWRCKKPGERAPMPVDRQTDGETRRQADRLQIEQRLYYQDDWGRLDCAMQLRAVELSLTIIRQHSDTHSMQRQYTKPIDVI